MSAVNRILKPEYILENSWRRAKSARETGNTDKALAIAAEIRSLYPDYPDAYEWAASLLTEEGRQTEADSIKQEAVQRFPSDPEVVIKRAAAAAANKDWASAAQHWAALRAQFPQIVAGYTNGALAHREARQFAKADAILLEGKKKFPADVAIASEYCWVAQIARNFEEAERRWSVLRSEFPDLPVGWIGGSFALRELRRFGEAEDLLRNAMKLFPDDEHPVVEFAWMAAAQRKWLEATERWATVRGRFPDRHDGYLRGGLALAELWRFDEATAVLTEGMSRFPDHPELAVEYAAIAFRQGRLDEAAARYEAVRRKFPKLPDGYVGGALTLRNQFRLGDAEAMLETAQSAVGDDPQIALEHAMLPIFPPFKQDQNPDETIRRLIALTRRCPYFERGQIALVRILRETKRLDEAEEQARVAVENIPASGALAVERANVARDHGNQDEAIRRYNEACERFPNEASGFAGLGSALAGIGHYEEADTVFKIAMNRFPTAQALFMGYAEVAVAKMEWREAVDRLSEGQRRFPDDKAFARRISDIRLQSIGGDAVDVGVAHRDVTTDDPREKFRELVIRFESLGGRGIGCEFGMFQREFGAEPLGLLRWADMPYEGIVSVLENRFEGIGLPENTEVFVNRENDRPEYCTRDRRGYMFMRAFVYEDEMPIGKMREQALRRLLFLKKKLIADLEDGSKIFVWRLTERNLTDAELDRLHKAVRSYGDNILLYVRYEDEDHPNGTVEIRAPGLMVGYMDRFKMDQDGNLAATPASASWTTLCKTAHNLLDAASPLHRVRTT